MQEGLARAGIDTFAPSLLGYGQLDQVRRRSGRPGQHQPEALRSGRHHLSPSEGCDRTNNPLFPLDQQGTLLNVNPLAGKRRAHSSSVRFATYRRVGTRHPPGHRRRDRPRPADGRQGHPGGLLARREPGRADAVRGQPGPSRQCSDHREGQPGRVRWRRSSGDPTEETPPPGALSRSRCTWSRTGKRAAFCHAAGTRRRSAPAMSSQARRSRSGADPGAGPGGARLGRGRPRPPDRPQPLAHVLHLRLEQRRRGAADPTHAGHAGSRRPRSAGCGRRTHPPSTTRCRHR